MYYSLIKPFLFRMDPEKAHHFTLRALTWAYQLGLTRVYTKNISPCQLMGLTFDNPIGLAAGLDKNGDYIEALASLGFGFIEIGTVTPKPQAGNPLPRLFRLPEHQAIVNRMGFNNKGLDYVVGKLKTTSFKGILGVNIGKNHETLLENAHEDYALGFRRVAQYASYVTINISSPNTENLRNLQQSDFLKNLLHILKQEQKIFFDLYKKYVPLVIKIAPDLSIHEIRKMADIFLAEKIDGVIATNTTINHTGIGSFQEKGGLSGKPLADKSTDVIRSLYESLQDQIPIIGCGGIFSGKDIEEKSQAGASAFQIYTSLIYEGPEIIYSLVEAVKRISD